MQTVVVRSLRIRLALGPGVRAYAWSVPVCSFPMRVSLEGVMNPTECPGRSPSMTLAVSTMDELMVCATPTTRLASSSRRIDMSTETAETDQAHDIELLRKIGLGDRDSLSDLYDRYSTVLYSVALRVLNNQTEAEDLLQDVFIQIWEKASLYDPSRGKPLTWVISLTRNRSIDRLRSLQRRHRLKEDVEKENNALQPGSPSDTRKELFANETSRVIRAAVMQLSDQQRQAIELAYFSGLTQNEIALKLDEPLGTIKARIRRGMIRLKEMLTDVV